jgi:hypothetical protein
MRYAVLPALWRKLDDDERTLRWLGRKAHVDPSHLSLLRSGQRQSVNAQYAERIVGVLGGDIADFFVPFTESKLTESESISERVAD